MQTITFHAQINFEINMKDTNMFSALPPQDLDEKEYMIKYGNMRTTGWRHDALVALGCCTGRCWSQSCLNVCRIVKYDSFLTESCSE